MVPSGWSLSLSVNSRHRRAPSGIRFLPKPPQRDGELRIDLLWAHRLLGFVWGMWLFCSVCAEILTHAVYLIYDVEVVAFLMSHPLCVSPSCYVFMSVSSVWIRRTSTIPPPSVLTLGHFIPLHIHMIELQACVLTLWHQTLETSYVRTCVVLHVFSCSVSLKTNLNSSVHIHMSLKPSVYHKKSLLTGLLFKVLTGAGLNNHFLFMDAECRNSRTPDDKKIRVMLCKTRY